ncbi:MAG TPA: response regulator [Ramlibacter sp.]|uniref:response regulator transcription factor n=1 Tax=Ramlibacter sp. TaxID=1917967 RepID=UPI002B5ECB6D|nr:response regulator [Ramlibacter sp.]HVZ45158.1 response regulator [Ramlibacter sp.]
MHSQTVFIVEDDASVRDALSLLLSLRGYATAVFASAEDFLGAVAAHWRGVVIADIRMPGMSGLDLQAALAEHPARLPFIIVTGHGDIAAARQAFKAGAVDFLEKPFDDERLLRSIEEAMRGLPPEPRAAQSISPREREVLDLVVQGLDNRSIGERLAISPRTVEVHKARVMAKLGASNLPELIRIAGERRG